MRHPTKNPEDFSSGRLSSRDRVVSGELVEAAGIESKCLKYQDITTLGQGQEKTGQSIPQAGHNQGVSTSGNAGDMQQAGQTDPKAGTLQTGKLTEQTRNIPRTESPELCRLLEAWQSLEGGQRKMIADVAEGLAGKEKDSESKAG